GTVQPSLGNGWRGFTYFQHVGATMQDGDRTSSPARLSHAVAQWFDQIGRGLGQQYRGREDRQTAGNEIDWRVLLETEGHEDRAEDGSNEAVHEEHRIGEVTEEGIEAPHRSVLAQRNEPSREHGNKPDVRIPKQDLTDVAAFDPICRGQIQDP